MPTFEFDVMAQIGPESSDHRSSSVVVLQLRVPYMTAPFRYSESYGSERLEEDDRYLHSSRLPLVACTMLAAAIEL